MKVSLSVSPENCDTSVDEIGELYCLIVVPTKSISAISVES